MIENLGNKRVLTEAEQTMYDDWHKSGIDDNTIMSYVNAGLLKAHGDYWELFYPQKNNTPNEYYTQRFYNNCKNKYIRPKGKESQIFIPLGLHNSINNKDDYLIITEGEKKAIKASLEGFNCVAIPGVYCWKRNPLKQEELKDKTVAQIEEILDEEDYPSDIISSLSEMQLKGKPIYLCFDNDVMTKEMVKEALLMLSGYLIGEKEAIVKIIYLPQSEDKLGLDDYLIKYGKEDFTRLLEKAQTVTLKSIQNDMMGVKNTKNKFPMDIFEDDLKNLKLEEIGSIIENYKYFPNKTNVEFVKVMNRNKIKVMVWERGVGRTLGCGTGACSATVVSILKNYINNEVVVELEGGIVKVKYDVDTNSVILMGNAEKVFKGEIDI